MDEPNAMDSVRLLVENGADVSMLSDEGETVLMHLCLNCPENLVCLEYLIQNGCPVDHVSPNGGTVMKILASFNNGLQAMRWLLIFAKPNADLMPNRGDDCRTVLMVAAAKGRTECLRLLLSEDVKASVNIKDQNGRTALDWAARSKRSNIECMLHLIRCGGVFHPKLCGAQPVPKFQAFLREYPAHYLSALVARLGLELAELVSRPAKLSPTVARKIHLEQGNDLDLRDIFNLPYHRVLDGVSHVYSTIPENVQSLCKALAKAAHETQAARETAETHARECTKKMKI